METNIKEILNGMLNVIEVMTKEKKGCEHGYVNDKPCISCYLYYKCREMGKLRKQINKLK